MLQLDIEEQEFFDEAKNEFIHIEPQKLSFEHSLISLSKWESKWHKPFLKPGDKKTQEESIDYIRCMCINKNVNPIVFWSLKQEQIDKLEAYIADPMTGTTISNVTSSPSRQIMTSELFYYYINLLIKHIFPIFENYIILYVVKNQILPYFIVLILFLKFV